MTVLYPSPKGSSILPEVKPLACLLDGKCPPPGRISAISVKLPEYEDVFVTCHDPADFPKVKRFLGFELTGEAVWIRLNRKGEIVKKITLGDAIISERE